jgi:hypothetical protein
LFPWVGYVILGGVLGSYLAKHPLVFKTNKFSLVLSIVGFGLILISMGYVYFAGKYGYHSESTSYTIDTIIFRAGFVLVLNSIVSFISQKIESIPRVIILVGRNTLLIYVIHLIILFGSAWNPGLYGFFAGKFTVIQTIVSALLMITLMTIMVLFLSKLKFRNKQLVT